MDALWTTCAWQQPAAPTTVQIISEDDTDLAAAGELLRRGPWTADEDALLSGYVAAHGEGRWNETAAAAGLRRTGKSCRLRWLNYLRPGVRRGDFTPREQLLVLELHARWGNRWSKIAAHLPGRTDNDVKNYWRTRVQKHARHLGCHVGSRRFHDAMRSLWMPRLIERIHADDTASAAADDNVVVVSNCCYSASAYGNAAPPTGNGNGGGGCARAPSPDASCVTGGGSSWSREASPDASHFQSSSCSTTMAAGCAGSTTEQCQNNGGGCSSATSVGDMFDESWSELLARANHDDTEFGLGETADNWWSLEDIWEQPLY